MKHPSDYQQLKAEALANPAVKAAYDALEDEYRLISQVIEARHAKHWTQTQLAQEIGVNQTAIARLEGGQSNPSYKTLARVAKALGKSLSLV